LLDEIDHNNAAVVGSADRIDKKRRFEEIEEKLQRLEGVLMGVLNENKKLWGIKILRAEVDFLNENGSTETA
ncbi:hypothetical protein BGX27_003670, partial [Mortierella sp. AM989]